MDNPTNYDCYRYVHAKSSWMSARDELVMVAEMAELGEKDGNLDAMMKDGLYGAYLAEVEAPEPGYSFFISVVPMVYSLLNSIELTMKAFNYVGHPTEAPKNVLKFADYLDKFHADFSEQTIFTTFIDTYTQQDNLPVLLKDFLVANDMQICDLFNIRRNTKSTSFFTLVEPFKPYPYSPEQGKAFFAQVKADASKIHQLLDCLQAGIDEDGNPTPAIEELKRD
jgi:hypothetical protein